MRTNFSQISARKKLPFYYFTRGWRPNWIFEQHFLLHIYTIKGICTPNFNSLELTRTEKE